MRRLTSSLLVLPAALALSFAALAQSDAPVQCDPAGNGKEPERSSIEEICLELGRYVRRAACLGTTMP